MNEEELNKIMKELKENDEFVLGSYERIYPDCPNESVKGEYKLVISLYGCWEYELPEGWDDQPEKIRNEEFKKWKNSWRFASGKLEIIGVEGNYDLDIPNSPIFLYENYSSEYKTFEDFWKLVEKELKSFKSIQELTNKTIKAFGFDLTKTKYEAYNLIKEELPDGMNFESFNESFL